MQPEPAAFAADPGRSRGRLPPEPPPRSRRDLTRDCGRIIHPPAVRRRQNKTQVFVFHEGDHYRTRLTHTLEVAQIARALARSLRLDEDLAEALALAHDLGHTPFGHAGERALDACLADFGGFDHNAQTLRIVTSIERRYPGFDGLNLTWETLEGIVKHNGPLTDRDGYPFGRHTHVPAAILDYVRRQDLQLWSYPSLEAQVAAIADDIAYDAHDIDDGLRADLFGIEDLAAIPLIREILDETQQRFAGLDPSRLVHQIIRRLINRMIEDVVGESGRRLAACAPKSADEVRAAGEPLAGFSLAMAEADRAIKGFLYPRMYRHERVMRVMTQAEGVVRDLFGRYLSCPADLPPEWIQDLADIDETARARRVGDFIAGMTDRFALGEHARLFGSNPELR